MSTIALSGWGQPHDALREAAPHAVHVDYARTGSLEAALDMLSLHAGAETVIGWSMGGQLAMQAIARGILKPERLVLIATPRQFAASEDGALGLGPVTLAQFRDNLARNAERTLNKAYSLIAYNDAKADTVQGYLEEARARVLPHDWRYWFDALAEHQFAVRDFSGFPPALLIHGDRDVVVDPAQSQALLALFPRAELHVFEGSGHAPHWHDAPRLRKLIAGEK